MMRPVVSTESVTLYLGDAENWPGVEPIDLVFTNPYGPLPLGLRDHPMVIHQWAHRKRQAEAWTRNRLTHVVGSWNRKKEVFWSANIDQKITVNIEEFVPEQPGWYPEEMAERLLKVFGRPGYTIWDGFMGRGTVGKIARKLGMKYVGVEQLPEHLTLAREYLNV